MSNHDTNGKPNPGSVEAREQGCTCPIMDNGHGNPACADPRGWWINADCPIHAEKGGEGE